jgi:hypothetical protein
MKALLGITALICVAIAAPAHAQEAELGSWMNASKAATNECIKARKELEKAEDYLDNVSRPSSFELKMLTNAEEDVALHCNVASY